MALEASRVEEIFLDCLFKEDEDTSVHIVAEGITGTIGLHPSRVEEHKAEIEAMLEELPDDFKADGGGGASFLMACNDRHGNQWTGVQKHMEQLFQLGIAIGMVTCPLPRAMWSLSPGGVPYYIIN